MQVIRAHSAGFCLGVSLALRRLDAELAAFTRAQQDGTADGRLVTLGPIIHNPLVMKEYAERGVLCKQTLEGMEKKDRVVIRAHGIPREIEEQLKACGAQVIDATCPKVKKAQLAIGKQHAKGYFLLLFGEKEHPEVQGLLSYAENQAMVFGSLRELEDFDLDSGIPYFLAAQTTQERALFLQAKQLLNERLGHAIPVLDTICDATRNRQEEVISLSRKVEAMVVVGGLNSGNTRRLAEVARAQGVPTIHVEQVADMSGVLPHGPFAGVRVVGLTAGASTPDKHIDSMQVFLESL